MNLPQSCFKHPNVPAITEARVGPATVIIDHHCRQFMEQLRPFNICAFHAAVVVDSGMVVNNGNSCRQLKCENYTPDEILKLKCILASSEAIVEFRNYYLKKLANRDPQFNCPDKSIHHYANNDFNEKNLDRLMASYGIHSRISSKLTIKQRPGWVIIFHLYANDEHLNYSKLPLDDSIKINKLLREFIATMLALHNAKIHPFINQGLISSKTIQILKHLSYGYSNHEIAELMHLSERGVSYHVDNLKTLLGVRNRIHLVAEAFRHYLLLPSEQ